MWNKSNREHTIIGTEPVQTRDAADAAVKEMGWSKPYFLDADHINLKTVQRFLDPCDFFTLDVADMIGQPAKAEDVAAFLAAHAELIGTVTIPGIAEPFHTDKAFVEGVADKFLAAVQNAGEIYQLILLNKGAGRFVAEISMDETDLPQTPVELLIILAAIADQKIPIQTIAPKFTGRFNKGVDYVGDVKQFAKEFEEDLAAIAYAIKKLWVAREPEAERAFGLGQVLHLQGDPRRREEVQRRGPPEDRGDDLAGRADRAGGGGRQRAGDCEGDL